MKPAIRVTALDLTTALLAIKAMSNQALSVNSLVRNTVIAAMSLVPAVNLGTFSFRSDVPSATLFASPAQRSMNAKAAKKDLDSLTKAADKAASTTAWLVMSLAHFAKAGFI